MSFSRLIFEGVNIAIIAATMAIEMNVKNMPFLFSFLIAIPKPRCHKGLAYPPFPGQQCRTQHPLKESILLRHFSKLFALFLDRAKYHPSRTQMNIVREKCLALVFLYKFWLCPYNKY